jgi:hypothetical protein
MSVQLCPANITVNLPMLPTEKPGTYSLPERHYDAEPCETVEQLLARVTDLHPDAAATQASSAGQGRRQS